MCGLYKDGALERQRAILEKASIAEEDKTAIRDYVNFKIAEKGLTATRAAKLMGLLRSSAERFTDGQNYASMKREEIVRTIARIEGAELKAWSKRDFKLILRMFLLWLGKDAAWIKIPSPRNDVQPEDMLSPDEVNALIDAALSLRDKAFIATLYEGGFRIAELATARVKDVTFDGQGAIMHVRGKTGLRRVRLVTSTPHLAQYLNAHPLRDNRDAPLWVYSDRPDTGLQYQAIRTQLNKIAARAGIKKRVNPHNFRHSRATFLASKLTEAQLEQYLGWEHGSDMPRIYVHMSGRDVDSAILEIHGMGDTKKKEEPTVKKCPFCAAINTADGKLCHLCKRPLEITAEGVLTLEEEVKELREKMAEMEEMVRGLSPLVNALRGEEGEEFIARQIAAKKREKA